MNWSEKLSTRLAKKLTPEGAHYTVGQVSHGIELILFNMGFTLLLFSIAFFLDCLLETALITSIVMFTRTITGGVHLKSAFSCLLIGSILILSGALGIKLLGVVDSNYSYGVVLFISVFAYIMNSKYAPAKHLYTQYSEIVIKKSRKTILFFLFFGCLFSELLVYYNYSNLAFTYCFAVLLQTVLLHPKTFQLVGRVETTLQREG